MAGITEGRIATEYVKTPRFISEWLASQITLISEGTRRVEFTEQMFRDKPRETLTAFLGRVHPETGKPFIQQSEKSKTWNHGWIDSVDKTVTTWLLLQDDKTFWSVMRGMGEASAKAQALQDPGCLVRAKVDGKRVLHSAATMSVILGGLFNSAGQFSPHNHEVGIQGGARPDGTARSEAQAQARKWGREARREHFQRGMVEVLEGHGAPVIFEKGRAVVTGLRPELVDACTGAQAHKIAEYLKQNGLPDTAKARRIAAANVRNEKLNFASPEEALARLEQCRNHALQMNRVLAEQAAREAAQLAAAARQAAERHGQQARTQQQPPPQGQPQQPQQQAQQKAKAQVQQQPQGQGQPQGQQQAQGQVQSQAKGQQQQAQQQAQAQGQQQQTHVQGQGQQQQPTPGQTAAARNQQIEREVAEQFSHPVVTMHRRGLYVVHNAHLFIEVTKKQRYTAAQTLDRAYLGARSELTNESWNGVATALTILAVMAKHVVRTRLERMGPERSSTVIVPKAQWEQLKADRMLGRLYVRAKAQGWTLRMVGMGQEEHLRHERQAKKAVQKGIDKREQYQGYEIQ
jgi:hypothetical protein